MFRLATRGVNVSNLPSMTEQRRHVRQTLEVEFQARDAQGVGQLTFQSADLSPGGTFLKSELLLEQGETLSLEFRLPGTGLLVRAQARVAWVRRFPFKAEPAGMGMEFLVMDPAERQALVEHLSAAAAT